MLLEVSLNFVLEFACDFEFHGPFGFFLAFVGYDDIVSCESQFSVLGIFNGLLVKGS